MVTTGGRIWWSLGRVARPLPRAAQPLARPLGPLVWLHVPGQASASAMIELAHRLIEEDGVLVLMTGLADFGTGMRRPKELLSATEPADQPAEVRQFLDQWRPDAIIFAEGEVRPALLHEAHERRVPMLMVDGREPYLMRGRESWIPGTLRRALALIDRIYALDTTAARMFRKAGAVQNRVAITGRMEESSSALPYLEAERESLAELLVARPVWFGAMIPKAEEAAVMEAHRLAMGQSHRLLFILLPENPDRAEPLAAELEAQGWSVAVRSNEEEPESDIEVYIVSDRSELGLWYRLAPICFLGGSLSGEGAIANPLEPAALGSAILHGPRPGAFGVPMGRLGAARAAKAVASARDLREALGDFLSPEKVARLAQAAWGVVSEGAEVTEDVLATLRRMMDGES